MLVLLIVTSLAVGAQAQGAMPYCESEVCNCSPPRDSRAVDTNIIITEPDPLDPSAVISCVCHCGKAENEGCVLGSCGYGLRCLHSKHTHTNGGNICRPVCMDKREYMPRTYTDCEVDVSDDMAQVVPRILECGDYTSPVSAFRRQADEHTAHLSFHNPLVGTSSRQVDEHIAHLSFHNPCEMSNANAHLIMSQDLGGTWQIDHGTLS